MQGGELNPLEDYTFYTALFADEAMTQRISDVKPLHVQKSYSASAVFTDLPFGTYYVAETDEQGNPISEAMFIESNEIVDGQAVLTPSHTSADSRIINYVRDFPDDYYKDGEIQVDKKVVAEGKAYAVTDTFYFALFLDKELTTLSTTGVKSLNLNNESQGTVIFKNVPYGEYYLAETNEDGVPVDDTYGYTVSIDEELCQITEAEKKDVRTVVNEVEIPDLPVGPYNDGEITVDKSVLVNGEAGKVTDTFYFALFLDEELTMLSEAPIQKLVLKNQSQGSVTFKNIPYGEYYLAETDEDGVPVDENFDYTVSIDKTHCVLTENSRREDVKVVNSKTTDTEPKTETESETEPRAQKETKKEKDKKDGSPKTGDNTPVENYAGLMTTAFAVLLLLVVLELKKRRLGRNR